MISDNGRERARRAAEAMRRFIKSRWEERDATLFLTDRPAPNRKRPSAVRAPAGQPGRSLQPPAGPPAGSPPYRPVTPPKVAIRSGPAPSWTPRPGPGAPPRGGAPGPKAPQGPKRHPSGIIEPESSEKGKALLALYEKIKDCAGCPLKATRRHLVFGMGRADTPVVFVGEAPGEQEDNQGLPFVGAAGHLLDKVLGPLGLPRDRFFICNVLKCRPPGNRNPSIEEMEECEPHLFNQLKIIAPKYVVALGTFAAQSVLKTTKPIGQLRGRWHRAGDFEVLPTYHPAAACRTTQFRKVLEGDLALLKQRLEGAGAKSSS